MKWKQFWLGLSGKLLILTIIFIMITEIILFIPSAAMYRQNWLQTRVSAAQQLTLAISGVPDFMSSELLSTAFMRDNQVTAVMQKKQGMSEAVLGTAPADAKYTIIDMRHEPSRIPDIGATLRSYFGDGQGYTRVLAMPVAPEAQSLELILPNTAIQKALIDYCHRIIALSLIIAVITGLLIYFALSWLIVMPIQRLASALSDFRQDPEKMAGKITDSQRSDEIGDLEREFIEMKTGIRSSLKQKDHLAMLGLAVAKINHDLRNVLTSAQLISDRLATDNEDRIRRMGERLVRAVDRGVQLCADTLSYSKSDQSVPIPQTLSLSSLLNEAAADALESPITSKPISWANHVDASVRVMADPDQAYRIFNNLCRNAAQALNAHEGNEHPSLIARVQEPSKDTNRQNGDKDVIVILLQDNGPGLSERAQKNLFQPFTGTAKGGTGLGLTISRELAQAHGGDLALISSSPEQGTTFSIRLPKA